MNINLFITGTETEILRLTKLKTQTLRMSEHRPEIERAMSIKTGYDLKIVNWQAFGTEDRITIQFESL